MPRTKRSDATKPTGIITIENAHPNIERIPTKLFSFDHATGGGPPSRSILEISGYTFSGKSTLAYHVLGMAGATIPGPEVRAVAIADFEGLDYEYVTNAMGPSGFQGIVRFVPLTNAKGKPQMSEDMLNDLAKDLGKEEVRAALVDSVGAIYTVSEEEGRIGEGRVGRRASIMADFLRKCVFRMRWKETPSIVVLTNHVHEIIGGRGTITSGGKAVEYLSATRVRLQADKKDDLWIVKGKIGKVRYRGNRPLVPTFQYAVIPGVGIHLGLSAVQDCIAYGLAKEDRTVTLEGKSYGYMSKLVKGKDDEELFMPFHRALASLTEVPEVDSDEETE